MNYLLNYLRKVCIFFFSESFGKVTVKVKSVASPRDLVAGWLLVKKLSLFCQVSARQFVFFQATKPLSFSRAWWREDSHACSERKTLILADVRQVLLRAAGIV